MVKNGVGRGRAGAYAAAMETPLLAGIVLAAGRSSRAGRFKPLAPLGGEPLVRAVARALLARCGAVTVVVGPRADDVAAALADLPGVETAAGPDPGGPMFGSVRAGAAAADPRADALLIQPVDCLPTAAAVLEALIAAWDGDGRRRAAVPVHAGRGGHPLLLPGAARDRILAADAGATLRDVAAALGILRVAVDDPAVLSDLDRPEDFRGLED